MGTSGWVEFVPYEPDLSEALWKARRAVFETGDYQPPAVEGVDLETITDEEVKGLLAEGLGVPLEMIEDMLAAANEEPRSPEPRDELDRRIDRMLALTMDSGSHSILDMTRVDEEPDLGAIVPLTDDDLRSVLGTAHPTRLEIEQDLVALQTLRPRWQGSVFVVYDGDGNPTELCFLGVSGD